MSAMLVVTAIGTAASIYSGQQAGKRADSATSAAQAALAENQRIASELKARQVPIDAAMFAKIGELQGKNITPAGQQGLDRFSLDMSAIDRAIEEKAPQSGEGVTGSREITQQFRKAQGIANINLQDQAMKNQQLAGWLGMASQTPGWAGMATGANANQARFSESKANQLLSQESSDYGQAARGLSNLADMYSQGYRFGVNPYNPKPSTLAPQLPEWAQDRPVGLGNFYPQAR